MKVVVGGISPLIAVDRKAAKPLHRQIYDAYRARILSGNLRASQLIPSTRALASELGISRIPVLTAYAQLLAEGYFESRVGSGTFVSSSLPERLIPREDRGAVRAQARSGRRTIAARAAALPRYERPPWIYGRGAFNVSQPAFDAFPSHVWSNLVARYARNLHVSGLQYGGPMGLQELREAIATYLRTARGVRCEPQQIMVVSGSQQALDISSRVLLNPGAPVWVEEPGYWLVRDILTAAGCRLVPVPVDEEGLDVAAGIKRCSKAQAAHVAPSHQYPLGVTMSASRRLQLLDWAHRSGSWIVEDDYDSEYRYETMPIASLQGLDQHSRVIYVGTFSKVLFPSLRLGYVVIPPDLVERFIAVRHAMDICPSHLHQAVLADFIREGHFSRHIRRMRQLYAERRRVLVGAIQNEFGPSLKVLGGEAGMHLLLILPDGCSDREISARAAEKNLWLWPLSPCYLGKQPRQGFILGFGNTTPAEIPRAVRGLKGLLSPAGVGSRS
ncbi:MAG TPA: PLP-dependent aminotransferase family protein [Candidatus Acidoferrum sp.]|nr:PLP-dependent aminotransferase family protein [Candidatus Acidoferrum sp.]